MDRILIIDDDMPIREILREILELHGYDVETAEGGTAGIEMHRANQYDLVITDLIMPHKNGITVIGELKKDFPDLPIIAMSGTERLEVMADAVDVDANRLVSKPFKTEEMLDAIAQLLEAAAV